MAIVIEHQSKGFFTFRPVYRTKDGKEPSQNEDGAWNTLDGKRPKGEVESFTLNIGSSHPDVQAVDGRKSSMEIPKWALDAYRRQPLFKNYEAHGHVRAVEAYA